MHIKGRFPDQEPVLAVSGGRNFLDRRQGQFEGAALLPDRKTNNSPQAAPPKISAAPAICTMLKVSPNNAAEKISAESGSR